MWNVFGKNRAGFRLPAIFRLSTMIGVFVFIIGSMAIGHAADIKPPQSAFDADITMFSEGETLTGHFWYDDGLERREMSIRGEKLTLIVRPDKDAVFMIPDGQPMVMQMKISPELQFFNGHLATTFKSKAVGEDKISGEKTTEYKVDGASVLGEKMKGHLWTTEDFIIMKVKGKAIVKGQWTDVSLLLENVVRKKPTASLFEVAPGVKIMKLN